MSEAEQGCREAPRSLEELLASIEAIEAPSGRIRFDEVLEAIGRRAFGPLLLLAGLVVLLPVIGDIPGVPLLMACFTLLVCVQLLIGRRTFWLPAWLRNRSMPRDKVHKALGWLHKPARLIDRLLHDRLTFMTSELGNRLAALACLVIALCLPPMELIPFSANLAGLALTLFGLSIMARDGLLAIFAFALTVAAPAVVLTSLL